uniref:Uncharacterized protein n=1 Tax=Romanomermis culicivorax TaxID=13658 RepID=A0A915J5F2_ROMCU
MDDSMKALGEVVLLTTSKVGTSEKVGSIQIKFMDSNWSMTSNAESVGMPGAVPGWRNGPEALVTLRRQLEVARQPPSSLGCDTMPKHWHYQHASLLSTGPECSRSSHILELMLNPHLVFFGLDFTLESLDPTAPVESTAL